MYVHAHYYTCSYEFTGGEIAKVICQAAESCALFITPSGSINHQKLVEAADLELKRKVHCTTLLPSMYE